MAGLVQLAGKRKDGGMTAVLFGLRVPADQKETRAFSWNERGPMVVVVIVGMVVGFPVESKLIDGLQFEPPQFGSPKLGWFRMFDASARSCTPISSVTLKFLPREKLITLSPGPTRLFLRSLPNVPTAGIAKAEVLYQPRML